MGAIAQHKPGALPSFEGQPREGRHLVFSSLFPNHLPETDRLSAGGRKEHPARTTVPPLGDGHDKGAKRWGRELCTFKIVFLKLVS